MAIGINPTNEELRRAVLALQTRSTAKGDFALTAGNGSTNVVVFGMREDSSVQLTPTSAGAAAESAWWVERHRGSFTVHHANAASTTRSFSYTVTL